MNKTQLRWLSILTERDIPKDEMPQDIMEKMLRDGLIESGPWLSSGEIVRISAYGKIFFKRTKQG
jgi:hypothetical protein